MPRREGGCFVLERAMWCPLGVCGGIVDRETAGRTASKRDAIQGRAYRGWVSPVQLEDRAGKNRQNHACPKGLTDFPHPTDTDGQDGGLGTTHK